MDFKKNRGSYLSVCFQLGKALRLGNAESFLKFYDKCIELLEDNYNIDQLDSIKELSRNLSDLPENQFSLFEQAHEEGLLTDEYSSNLREILSSLALKLSSNASDSGVYSDDAEICHQKIPQDNDKCSIPQDNDKSYAGISSEIHQLTDNKLKGTNRAIKPRLQSKLTNTKSKLTTEVTGTYMYSEGNLIKLKARNAVDQHKSCVQFLFKRWREVQRELYQNF